jgi:hypothetical protein
MFQSNKQPNKPKEVTGMGIQEAAKRILEEHGQPSPARELAKIALERGWATSNAKDPVASLGNTIDKNIREGTYNTPKLIHIGTGRNRQIGLPGWTSTLAQTSPDQAKTKATLSVDIPIELLKKLQLASQAGIAADFDETVSLLIQEGISSLEPRIREGIGRRLESLR